MARYYKSAADVPVGLELPHWSWVGQEAKPDYELVAASHTFDAFCHGMQQAFLAALMIAVAAAAVAAVGLYPARQPARAAVVDPGLGLMRIEVRGVQVWSPAIGSGISWVRQRLREAAISRPATTRRRLSTAHVGRLSGRRCSSLVVPKRGQSVRNAVPSSGVG